MRNAIACVRWRLRWAARIRNNYLVVAEQAAVHIFHGRGLDSFRVDVDTFICSKSGWHTY